jgi:hypothetical protein
MVGWSDRTIFTSIVVFGCFVEERACDSCGSGGGAGSESEMLGAIWIQI